MMLCVTAARLSAQTDHVQPKVHPEDREVDMDDPTFVPMVKGVSMVKGASMVKGVSMVKGASMVKGTSMLK
mgnify:CR=1 FL=1